MASGSNAMCLASRVTAPRLPPPPSPRTVLFSTARKPWTDVIPCRYEMHHTLLDLVRLKAFLLAGTTVTIVEEKVGDGVPVLRASVPLSRLPILCQGVPGPCCLVGEVSAPFQQDPSQPHAGLLHSRPPRCPQILSWPPVPPPVDAVLSTKSGKGEKDKKGQKDKDKKGKDRKDKAGKGEKETVPKVPAGLPSAQGGRGGRGRCGHCPCQAPSILPTSAPRSRRRPRRRSFLRSSGRTRPSCGCWAAAWWPWSPCW